MNIYPTAVPTDWTVVCLCAAWCRTCEGYGPAFAQRAEQAGDARHVWIDVEDDAAIVGDIDIETFPTLLVLQGDRPLFFGPVLPHIDVVDRTLRALQQHGAAGDPVGEEYRDAVEQVIALVRGNLRAGS
jgi:thioredoxin-like negative regulator of GroEL